MDLSRTLDDPNYWLDYWNAVYRYILMQDDLPLHIVDHDAMRAYPVQMLESIFRTLCVEADVTKLAAQITLQTPGNSDASGFDPELLNRAEATYRELLASRKNIFQTQST